MSLKYKSVLLLSVFNASTAIAGGIGLMSGLLSPPADLLNPTPFDSYVAPGIILLTIVGGSSLVAVVALLKKTKWNAMYAMAAGWIMWGWIVIEIILIDQLSWLQILYLGTAITIIWFSIPPRLDKIDLSSKDSYAGTR